MLEYLSSLTAQNNRDSQLMAARVEWMIYNGANTEFKGIKVMDFNLDFTDARYTKDLIQELGLLIGRAHGKPIPGIDFSPILRRSLRELSRAEKTMSENQKVYFQNQLAFYMTHHM